MEVYNMGPGPKIRMPLKIDVIVKPKMGQILPDHNYFSLFKLFDTIAHKTGSGTFPDNGQLYLRMIMPELQKIVVVMLIEHHGAVFNNSSDDKLRFHFS